MRIQLITAPFLFKSYIFNWTKKGVILKNGLHQINLNALETNDAVEILESLLEQDLCKGDIADVKDVLLTFKEVQSYRKWDC